MSLTLNERIVATTDALWTVVVHLNSQLDPICQIIGRVLIQAQQQRISDTDLAARLNLHVRDIRDHCVILRNQGFLRSEEVRAQTGPEEHSAALSNALAMAGVVASASASSSSAAGGYGSGYGGSHYRPVAHVYRYWVDPMHLTKIFKYRYLRMLEVLEKRGEQTVDEFYRCSAASVEQCTSVANLISQFDLVQYLDPVERAALCPTCRRRLKSNSDAAAEASSRHESTDLKMRLNAQFGDALRLIGELEALLRERSAGLIEREEERKKEVEAVKAGRQVVRSAAPKLLDSLGGAAPARVKLQAERSGGSAASSDNASAAAVAAGKQKSVLQFLPQARQNVVMRKGEAADVASGSLTTVNHSVSVGVAGGSAAARTADATATSSSLSSAQPSAAPVKAEVMSKEAYENLTALLAAQARESSSSSAVASSSNSSSSSSSMDDAFDASAGARADPVVYVGGRPKLASQVDPDDFSLMTDEEQLLYAEAMQEL